MKALYFYLRSSTQEKDDAMGENEHVNRPQPQPQPASTSTSEWSIFFNLAVVHFPPRENVVNEFYLDEESLFVQTHKLLNYIKNIS